MEFADVVRRRRMTRRFSPDPLPDDVLTEVLALGSRAPSAGFSQGRDVVVLRRRAEVDAFWELSTGPDPDPGRERWLTGMRTAPALLVCLSDPERYRERYARPDKAPRGTTRPTPGAAPTPVPPVAEAPATTAPAGAVAPPDPPWAAPYWDIDTGMSIMIMLLAAEDLGLGACFFASRSEAEAALRRWLGIPAGHRFVGVVAVGRAATGSAREAPAAGHGSRRHRPERRPLDEVAHDGRFGRPWPGPTASTGTTTPTGTGTATPTGTGTATPTGTGTATPTGTGPVTDDGRGSDSADEDV